MTPFRSFRRGALLCGAGLATVIAGGAVSTPQAMRELAAAKSVPLVDLTAASLALWNQQGVEGTKQSFMILAAGQYPNYPSGIEDNTHFQAAGAIEVARLVGTALNNQGILGAGYWQKLTTAILAGAVVWPSTAPTY